MKQLKRLFCLMMSLMFFAPIFGTVSPAAAENSIFVAPDGNDSAEGTQLAPLATPAAAKAMANKLGGHVTVYFRGGDYRFTAPLTFTGDDCGDVTFAAFNNEKVVFTAGTPYTGFEETTVNGVRAFKKYVGTDADFHIMFNETTTLRRTRYPEQGYMTVDKTTEDDIRARSTDSLFDAYTGFYTKPGEMQNFRNLQDVMIRILHYWKDEMVTVTAFDVNANHLSFSRGTSMRVAEGDRFFLENVFETLNEPGEWYLDKSEGVVYYIPQEGEQAGTLTLWGSETETLIDVDGVDGISFEGIIFRANGFNIPRNNREQDISSQAGIDATPCLYYRNASDFSLKHCEFRDIAACAVKLGYNVQNAAVDSCLFENIGAQAVVIWGENQPADTPTVTRNITVTNCLIAGYGRVFFNSVALLVMHANTVELSHNEIHDGYYTAISVGWVWGYGYTVTYNNKICDNLIYNIGQGWLSDMGGIYTLGNQPGTVLSGNVIHNVAADPGEGGYGGWGIYLDEGSAYMLVEKNLVFACGSDGYHQHYGSYNTIRNNIFALNGESQVRACSAPQRNTPADGGKRAGNFSRNILLTDGGVRTYSYLQSTEVTGDDGNIFWDMTKGDDLYVSVGSDAKDSLSLTRAVKKGYLNNPVVADPGFADAANFDFTLTDDSAAVKAGFEAWDYQNAGTLKDSVVGTGTPGGTTDCSAGAQPVPFTAAKEPWHWFFTLIQKIMNFLTGLFRK